MCVCVGGSVGVCVWACVCVCVCVCVWISLLTEWFHVFDFQIPKILSECESIPGSPVCIAILYGGT